MTFTPATIAPEINANIKHNPKPNPNPNLNPYLINNKTQSLPSPLLFAVRDIIAGANCCCSKCRITKKDSC